MLLKPFWDNFFHSDTVSDEVIDVLKKNPLFSDFGFRDINKLMPIVYPRVYQRGEFIFRQKQLGLGMYMVVSGAVSLGISDQNVSSSVSESGLYERVILRKYGFFGESALVDEDGLRTLDAIAVEETKLISIFKPDLMDFVHTHRDMGIKITYRLAQVLSKRLSRDFEQMLELNRKLQEASRL